MIAKIIPLKRLPRHIDILDYTVPPELEQMLKIGQLVEIPFRQSTIFGLVFEFGESKKHTTDLKPLSKIVNEIPLVTPQYLSLISLISRVYSAPIGSVAHMGLLPLQKNKLKKIELQALRNSPSNLLSYKREGKATSFSPLFGKLRCERSAEQRGAGGELRRTHNNYFWYQNSEEHAQLFGNISSKHTTLIIVPEVRHIEEIKNLLPKNIYEHIVEWHSDLSTKEKFSRWLAIRNGDKKIIIGTRGTVFLPFTKLDQIIIDFEHDENHKHWDQAPRFHTKDLAPLVQHVYPNCELTLASFSPSFDAYYKITKENIPLLNKKIRASKLLFKKKSDTDTNLPILSTISQQGAYDGVRIFSTALETHLQTHIREETGDIFIFINKKGSASSLICKDCGYIETDPESGLPLIYKEQTKKLHAPYSLFSKPLPASCAKCTSRLIKMFGIGSESVEKEIKKMLDKKTDFEVLRIDSDSQNPRHIHNSAQSKIIIGTQMAFQYVDWDKTKLIIFLDLDRQLALPEYLATEHVWHLIAEAQYRRIDSSNFYIQTRNPEHILFKSLGEADRLYRTELGKRQKLGYPPYMYLTRFFYGNYSNFTAKQECAIVCEQLRTRLTHEQKSAILLGPFEMHPRFFRNKYWYGFLAKLSRETWINDLDFINDELGLGWKVDPNPISVLSP